MQLFIHLIQLYLTLLHFLTHQRDAAPTYLAEMVTVCVRFVKYCFITILAQ